MEDIYTVYVLFSKSSGKTYTGMTSDLINRFHSHNTFANKAFATKYRPWSLSMWKHSIQKKKLWQGKRSLNPEKEGNGLDKISFLIIINLYLNLRLNP